MIIPKYVWCIGLGFVLMAFGVSTSTLFIVPSGWPAPIYDFSKNELTEEKVALGRALFYDPILSKDNTISCASCHSVYSAFTHVDHALSHGIGDSIGTRNASALMNLAWQSSFMRDGAIHHLDMQALAPISHPSEMGETIENVVKKLGNSRLYQHLFYQAFGDSMVSGERTLKAIAQFSLTLVSGQAKYDSVMQGTSVFTEIEAKGYQLFKQHCGTCHTEPLFTNDAFIHNGLPIDTLLMDMGRARVTQLASDNQKFRVPTLRNIEFSYPYMHDGRFKKLSQVLNHYVSGVEDGPTVDPRLKGGLRLTPNEKVDITAFLLTLTDKSFLFNPKFAYPKEIFLVGTKD